MLFVLIEKLSKDQHVLYMSLIVLVIFVKLPVFLIIWGQCHRDSPRRIRCYCSYSVCTSDSDNSVFSIPIFLFILFLPVLLCLLWGSSKVACPKVGNTSKWFDPTFPRDFKLWCLSEPSAQYREVVSVSAVTLKKKLPAPLRRPALSP